MKEPEQNSIDRIVRSSRTGKRAEQGGQEKQDIQDRADSTVQTGPHRQKRINR